MILKKIVLFFLIILVSSHVHIITAMKTAVKSAIKNVIKKNNFLKKKHIVKLLRVLEDNNLFVSKHFFPEHSHDLLLEYLCEKKTIEGEQICRIVKKINKSGDSLLEKDDILWYARKLTQLMHHLRFEDWLFKRNLRISSTSDYKEHYYGRALSDQEEAYVLRNILRAQLLDVIMDVCGYKLSFISSVDAEKNYKESAEKAIAELNQLGEPLLSAGSTGEFYRKIVAKFPGREEVVKEALGIGRKGIIEIIKVTYVV